MDVTYWREEGRAGLTTDPDRVPVGAVITTREGYEAFVADKQAALPAMVEERKAAAAASAAVDYAELRKAGVSDATARRLSGHRGGAR